MNHKVAFEYVLRTARWHIRWQDILMIMQIVNTCLSYREEIYHHNDWMIDLNPPPKKNQAICSRLEEN